ncbi:hypothetical protein [Streptomyces sp. NPDC060001]|uniref:hypothetical protein n=1 Tax=Streptomyces sp. NPDC060001 TaxID=3347032 RepID=UPI0036797DF1
MTKLIDTDDKVWATTKSNAALAHAFDSEHRAICRTSIRSGGEYRTTLDMARDAVKLHEACARKLSKLEAAPVVEEPKTSKVYERTENGTVTHISIREAMAEVEDAMMGRVDRERRVRTMSSGRTQHHIVYSDGRDVRMVLVDAPAVVEPEQGAKVWTGESTRVVTVKGKRYVVGTIRQAGDHGTYRITRAYVSYWTERNGGAFGATRSTNGSAKPGTVGRAIWDAVNR